MSTFFWFYSYLYSFTAFVGSISTFIILLKLLTSLRKFYLREPFNLGERYGAGTWSLITAPTSATGHGFAVLLAKKGFNIVLVGRDIEKLQKMRDLLILKHNIKIRTITCDFRQAEDPLLYSNILQQVEDLDVSILVNAAGMVCLSKKFHNQPPQTIRQCLAINMFTQVLLSQQLIPRLQYRYHRSAIINVSGENAYQPIPGMAVSSGAKSFCRMFTVAASYEYEEKIDIMAVQPMAVKKKSSDGTTRESIFVVDSEKFASACLRQLGHERSTNGHWIHQIQSWGYTFIPDELKLNVWFKLLLPNIDQSMEKKK